MRAGLAQNLEGNPEAEDSGGSLRHRRDEIRRRRRRRTYASIAGSRGPETNKCYKCYMHETTVSSYLNFITQQ